MQVLPPSRRGWITSVEEGKGWAEMLIPDDAYPQAAECAIDAGDSAQDKSVAGRNAAASAALRAAVNAAGEGFQVTDEQCAQAAAAILTAVAVVRKGTA